MSRRTPHDFCEMACKSCADRSPAPGISRSMRNLGMTFSLSLKFTFLIGGQLARRLQHVFDLRQMVLFERRRVGHGRIGGGEAHHRRVEPLESLLADGRGYLAADAARPRSLVQDEHLARLLRRPEYRLPVHRRQRAEV